MRLVADLKMMGNTIVIQTKHPPKLEDGQYSIEINTLEKDKSRRQVNYFWEILRAIAIKNDGNTQDLEKYYGQCLKWAGIKMQGIWIKDEALDEFKKLIKHFIVMEKKGGFSRIEVYKGISEMSVKEMQQLIDVECKYASELGINTDIWND